MFTLNRRIFLFLLLFHCLSLQLSSKVYAKSELVFRKKCTNDEIKKIQTTLHKAVQDINLSFSIDISNNRSRDLLQFRERVIANVVKDINKAQAPGWTTVHCDNDRSYSGPIPDAVLHEHRIKDLVDFRDRIIKVYTQICKNYPDIPTLPMPTELIMHSSQARLYKKIIEDDMY